MAEFFFPKYVHIHCKNASIALTQVGLSFTTKQCAKVDQF